MTGLILNGLTSIINDDKPSGLKTGLTINSKRDAFLRISLIVDETL